MITRRNFLRSIGGLAAAVPLLESLPAQAAGGYPKRFVVFFHPNGTMPDAWWPSRSTPDERDFDLNVIHAPLQEFKERLVLFRNVDLAIGGIGPGEPHQKGMGGVLTGRELLEGEFVGGDGSLAGWGSGISVDQEIAALIGPNTPLRSLELGVRATTAEVRARLSYLGPARPLPPQNDPNEVFATVFRDYQRPAAEVDRLKARRRSVLDHSTGQFRSLLDKISSRDRNKLEQHLELVRALERKLSPDATTCSAPEISQLDPDAEDDMPRVIDAQIELLAMAFACDITRVASIQIANAQNSIRYPWLGSLGVGHTLSHSGPSNANAHEEWVKRDTWIAGRFAHLLRRLASIPEGSGTVLDNTAVLWVNELSVGNSHSHVSMPFLLAGSAGGVFRTGRYMFLPSSRPHNDLLLTLLRGFGSDLPTFGHAGFNTGLIEGLLA